MQMIHNEMKMKAKSCGVLFDWEYTHGAYIQVHVRTDFAEADEHTVLYNMPV